MRVFSVKCACISDPLVAVIFFEVKQFVFEQWKSSLKEERTISDGLNSIKFLKFDQILQQQLYNISFPMIRFRFFGASKTTRKLSKPPKIITMNGFRVGIASCKREKLILNIEDFVLFVRQGIVIDHFDFFKSKLFYAINTCAPPTISIKLPTMDQLLKAVGLIPNVLILTIHMQDENLAVNSNDFEIFTRKIAKKTKLQNIDFADFNLPNNWEKICNENFKNLLNLRYLCTTDPVSNISINVIDLHDLMTENNISVGFWNIQDDSFLELPEFKDRFKREKQNSNQKQLFILENQKLYYLQPFQK